MKEAGSLEKADICLCIARRIRQLNAGFHGFSVGPFQRKKGLLHCQSAAVAGKASVCTDDAVAGDGDKNRVCVICHANRAKGLRVSNGPGDVFIAAGFAVRDLLQCCPDLFLKRSPVQPVRKIKYPSRSGKIFIQLPKHRLHQLVRCIGFCIGLGDLQCRDRAVFPIQLYGTHRRMINGGSFHGIGGAQRNRTASQRSISMRLARASMREVRSFRRVSQSSALRLPWTRVTM